MRENDTKTKYLVALETHHFIRDTEALVKDESFFTRFIGMLISFLNEHVLHGVALVQLKITRDQLGLATPALVEIHRQARNFGFEVLLGVTLDYQSASSFDTTLLALQAVARSVDVFVLESHFVPDKDSCVVNFPSVQRPTTRIPGTTLEDVRRLLAGMATSKNKTTDKFEDTSSAGMSSPEGKPPTEQSVPRMVCTIRYVSAGTLPEHVAPCDYLVYTGITHEGQNGTLVLQDDDDFGTFLALGGGFKPKLAVELKLAQLLDPEANSSMEAAMSTTRFWLSKQRINAVALFVDQDHYSESGQPKLLALVKVRSALQELPWALRHQHTICVSVSLAVLEFSSFGKPLKVGDACDAENWKPYSETCPKAKVLTMCDAEAMSDIEQDGGYTRTFETEDSLHLKVTKIQAALGARSCVAAFHLEYEDSGHSCRSRKAFSRVAAIAAAFDTGLLICVWSAVPPVPMKLSKGICNIMVYKHVQYNRTTDTVYLRNGALLERYGHLHSVCYATNLAVLQFRLKPQQSELDDNCLSEEWLTYSESNLPLTVKQLILSRIRSRIKLDITAEM
ncbi:hypothetical protein HPB47_012499 [Ixodes persulcatus]|uniref:Uncharacterized protein n=1 Tax=Ixodes persulcatus TaxID=34615 RepID=A0AC60NTB6_IXOPE|nr:hypothetical protein HPB47_012499 [Ixodes persulcatus]